MKRLPRSLSLSHSHSQTRWRPPRGRGTWAAPRAAVARPALAAVVLGLLAAPAAHGAVSPLVLQRQDAPGLKGGPARAAAAVSTVDAALRPAPLPAVGRERQASRFRAQGTDLWSLALVLRGPQAARAALAQTRARARRARIGVSRVGLGDRGWLFQRGGRPVVVVWRRGSALGAIVLRAPFRNATRRAVTVEYARAADVYLARLEQPVFDRLLDETRPDGSLPRAAALKLFALAYGPLPGTKLPPGPYRRIPDGTLVRQQILRYWTTLTAAQQQEALRLLGLSRVVLGSRHRERAHAAADPSPSYGDPNFVPDPLMTATVQTWEDRYAARIGIPASSLRLQVVAGYTTGPPGTAPSGDETYMDATPIEPDGTFSDNASVCLVRGFAAAKAEQGSKFWLLRTAHEAFHCIQFELANSQTAFGNQPDWIGEGTATWASDVITGFSWDEADYGDDMGRYLATCSKQTLFSREYDASGFWGAADQYAGPIWANLRTILNANNEAAFAAAGGNDSEFLESWASSTQLEAWGLHWWAREPLTPPSQGVACPATLARFPMIAVVDPYLVRTFVFWPGTVPKKSPLLHVQLDENGRLGDGRVDTTALEDAWFCVAASDAGCKCPAGQEGEPPPAVHLDLPADLSISAAAHSQTTIVRAVSLDKYCKEKQPPPPPPRPRGAVGGGGAGGGGGGTGCSSGCGSSNGDPHLTTFDGTFYDFQGAGEYTLVRSNSGDLEVQVRQQPYPGLPTLSINTAVAMWVNGDRVAVYRGQPLETRVNGVAFRVRRRAQLLPHGGRIRVVAQQVEVSWPDGTVARVWSVGNWGVGFLMKPAATRKGTLSGLLGNFDGNRDDDWVTRSGRRLPPPIFAQSRRLLYAAYGDSWRISQRGSLFDYGPGQSTKSFTNRRFPYALETAADLGRFDRLQAERACRRLRLRNPHILAACELDVGATGDYGFATAAKVLEQTAVRFGRPSGGGTGRSGPAVGRWTKIESGGKRAGDAALALDGAKVVAAYQPVDGTIETATFTPSLATGAAALRHDQVVAGWSFIGNISLLPRAGGGLQILFHGLRSSNPGEPLFGQILAPRNPDGSFGAPVNLTGSDSAKLGGRAVLAPSGEPLWAASTIGFWLWRGNPAVGNELTNVLPGPAYAPSLGRDSSGRYWLVWYALSSTPTARGIYSVQIDPATLQPIGAPQQAPHSGSLENDTSDLALACAQSCRLAYLDERAQNRVLSWAWGEREATTTTRLAPRATVTTLAAAYTASGRLGVAWYDRNARLYEAVLGNAAGAGGRVRRLGRPTQGEGDTGGLTTIGAGDDLVLVSTWATASATARYVRVLPPG